jgi:hypothetical protein
VVTSKLVTPAEQKRLDANAVAVLSKDHSARDVSLGKVRQALANAGLRVPEEVASHE